jgi:hypothetical protein
MDEENAATKNKIILFAGKYMEMEIMLSEMRTQNDMYQMFSLICVI